MDTLHSTRPRICSIGTICLILLILTGVSACTTGKPPTLVGPSYGEIQTQTPDSIVVPSISILAPPLLATASSPEYHQPGSVEIPILLYHHIATNPQDKRYYVDPLIFAEQMTWLMDHGYQTITETQLAEVIRKGGDLPGRPVIISFDDGDADLFTGALPVLQDHGMVGVAFIITGRLDAPGDVTSDEVKQLIGAGWEMGSHSEHHLNLVRFHSKFAAEIKGSKTKLETLFDIQVKSFAYPYGLMDQATAKFVADSGYTSAAGLGVSIVQSPKDLYYLSRIEIRGTYSMKQFTGFFPWQ